MRADVVIRNGRVIDGTGAPERRVDVAITGERIVGIGEAFDADTVFDASGKVVAPGFVDIHSHGDLVLAWPAPERLSLVEGRIAQGITTEIIGNCGLGASPLFGHGPELLPQLNGWMSPASFEWEWRDLAGYFDHLEQLGLPMNVGSLVPHGALRLGAAHLSPGETDSATRDQMVFELDRALEQGAFGLSAGLIYPPGMYTSTDELVALARRLERHDAVFTSHVRGSSETLLDAVDELISIGRNAGVHVHHSHAEAVGRSHWHKLEQFLSAESEARADGVHLSADMFPYPVAATMMLAIYPPWALEGGLARLIERLRDPSEREHIRRDIQTMRPEWPPWTEGGWPHNLVLAVGWERIVISTVSTPANKNVEGLTLAQLGEQTGRDPLDAISELMIEEDGNVGQFVLDITGEEGLRELMRRPDIAFVTDANDYGKGKPHPAAYGSFPRVLGRYVRDESLLSLPEAIRRMTSLPAETIGLDGRGRLTQGGYADITVFDADAVCDGATLARPRQKAGGIDNVFVNGKLAFADGALTGELAGAVLRSRKRINP